MSDELLIEQALHAGGREPSGSCHPIGSDRGFNSRVYRLELHAETLVAKVTTDPTRVERGIREIKVLEHLRTHAGLPAPEHLGHDLGTAPPHAVLLMPLIEGHEPDAECGLPRAELERTLAAMSGPWSTPCEGLQPILPAWGTGTVGHARPHQRRVERFVRKAESHLAQYGPGRLPEAAPETAEVIEWLKHNLEWCLKEAATWPHAVMHGDLHPENLVFRTDDVVVLDWQTTSLGPPIVDATRLIMDTQPACSAEQLFEFVEQVAARHQAVGGDPRHFLHPHRRAAIAAAITHAGFISGWGGRDPERMHPRERRLVALHASTRGPTAMVAALLRTLR